MDNSDHHIGIKAFTMLLVILVFSGYGTNTIKLNDDPYESFNRKMHGFNKKLTEAVADEAAHG